MRRTVTSYGNVPLKVSDNKMGIMSFEHSFVFDVMTDEMIES